MAENLVTYCVIHQPRRIKLPAEVIPPGTKPTDMAPYLFDDVLNKHYFDKVARWCYYPATEMFQDMLDRGFKLGLGFSVSYLWQLRQLGQSSRRALPEAGEPSQLRVGGRRALPQLRLCYRHQAVPGGDAPRQDLRRGVLRQGDPGHRHHRVGDEQRDLLRPPSSRVQRGHARRPPLGDGMARAHPPLLLTANATSLCSAVTTSCPTTWATGSATRPGPATPCAPTPTPPISARPGATWCSSAGTSRPSVNTTTSTPAYSSSCALCPNSSRSMASAACCLAKRWSSSAKPSSPISRCRSSAPPGRAPGEWSSSWATPHNKRSSD